MSLEQDHSRLFKQDHPRLLEYHWPGQSDFLKDCQIPDPQLSLR